ncbi:MAG TPA: thioredoxin fold domain-containing protein [bacterium]
MKKYFPILIVLTVALFALSCSDGDSQTKSNKKIVAENKIGKTMEKNFTLSFNDGLEKAAKEKKNMIVDFYTDWCHWCKVMDEKTFNNDSIAAKLSERFVTVRINAESPTETATFKGKNFTNIELTRAFQVTGFPSLAFISPELEVITIIPGYIQADQFTYILDYIDQECYKKKMSFEEFMKRKGECEEEKKTAPDSTTM